MNLLSRLFRWLGEPGDRLEARLSLDESEIERLESAINYFVAQTDRRIKSLASAIDEDAGHITEIFSRIEALEKLVNLMAQRLNTDQRFRIPGQQTIGRDAITEVSHHIQERARSMIARSMGDYRQHIADLGGRIEVLEKHVGHAPDSPEDFG